MEFKKIKFLSKQNEYDDVYSFLFDKKDVVYEISGNDAIHLIKIKVAVLA